MRRSILVATLALSMNAGCAGSPAMRAAERGDFATLRADVAAREKAGTLSNADAAKIARAVATWDLAHAPREQATARVRDLRSCVVDVDGALEKRSATRDAAGAEAALARLEARTLSESDARAYVRDADDGWRAVGARALVRDEDQAARAKAMIDGAPGVRRAAMHAAVEAKDARDVPTLAESARVDPEPLVRTDAVRALGAVGGDAAFAALRDLWPNADDALKEDIAAAWALPGLWTAGGRGELRLLVAAGHGPGAIAGAGAILGRGARAARDAEVDDSATALLVRTIGGTASHRDRAHAIALAPVERPALAEALRAAAKDDDVGVRVAALARLTELKSDRAASIAALEPIAADRDRIAAASRARFALASAGDLKVQALLEGDLASPEPAVRLGAAQGLATLGRPARAAPLLADADPAVRARAACTLLVAARSR
jgi:hypothetical protein